MFPSAEAKASSERAFAFLANASRKASEDNLAGLFLDNIDLERICHIYWSQKDYYNRVSVGRREITAFDNFKAHARAVLKVIGSDNSAPNRSVADRFVWRVFHGNLKWNLKEFEEALPAVRMSLRLIAEQQTPELELKSGRRERSHVHNAAVSLREVWLAIGGSPFPKNPEIAGVGSSAEFVHLGSQLVFKVLEAIDPNIRIAQVRTALKGPMKRTVLMHAQHHHPKT